MPQLGGNAATALHLFETPSVTEPLPTRRSAAFYQVLRPRQWIKNTTCLAGLIFSGQLLSQAAEVEAAGAALMFCLAASAVYILNDLCDRQRDRANPKKANRPIASGALSPTLAVVGGLILALLSCTVGALLGHACLGVILVYLSMNLAYCFWLKHAVLADVMVIALGFVLRVLAGVYAIHAHPTAWIVLCIFFLALLMGLAKRRTELAQLGERAAVHRPVLAKYSLAYVDALLAVMAVMTIDCYTEYAVDGSNHSATLIITIPPVVYGIGRFLMLVLVRDSDPAEEMLTRDRGLLLTVVVWVGLCVLVLYGGLDLFD